MSDDLIRDASQMFSARGSHVGFGEDVLSHFTAHNFMRHAPFPMLFADADIASFDHVSGIVQAGSEIEMFDSDASAIVPSWAIVQDFEAVRYFASEQDPRDPRGHAIVTAEIETAVAARLDSAAPNPAAVSLFNLAEKSLHYILGVAGSAAGYRAEATSAQRFTATLTHFGRLIFNHVTTPLVSLNVARGAAGVISTVAPRSLYAISLAVSGA